MLELQSPSIQMNSGKIFEGEKISELTVNIINKFADEKLSRDEAMEVLQKVTEVVGEYAIIKHID